MRSRLHRFVAVGVVATTVDVVLLLALHAHGWHILAADAAALAAAGGMSYLLHRTITLRDDPFVRWIHHAWIFLVVVLLAGLVDMAVLLAATGPGARHGVLVPKLLAVGVAAAVRFVAYRSLVFRVMRSEQDAPACREPAPGRFRLSVVVPAFREGGRIGATVERLRVDLRSVDASGGVEIVVVDDGSGDATADEARAAGADQVLQLPQNCGKGAAVRAGMLAANGRVVAFTDADLAYAPVQLLALLERVEAGWDVVVGNRRHVKTRTLVRAGRTREIGSRAVNVATQALLLGRYRDTQCGLKAFRSDVARLLFSSGRLQGFAFDIELFHLIERHRLSLAEVPVEVENSERSTVRAARDGLRLLRDLLRVRRLARSGHYTAVSVTLPPRGAPMGCDVARTR